MRYPRTSPPSSARSETPTNSAHTGKILSLLKRSAANRFARRPPGPRHPRGPRARGARALQLRPVEGVNVYAVPHDALPGVTPAEALSCREHDVVGDEHHHVDGVDIHPARHVVLDLEAMQTDDEPLLGPLGVAVPNRVRLTPFAHDDVRPLREQSAFGFVVIAGAGAGPAILSYLHAGLGREVGADVLEELEVVRRDEDPACLGHQGTA